VPERRVLTGMALVTLAGTAFGITPTLATISFDSGANPAGTLVTRFTIGATLLVGARTLIFRNRSWPERSVVLRLLGLGATGFFLGSFMYFTALSRIDTGLAVVLTYCYPAFVVFFGWWFLSHRPTRGVLVALVATTAGVFVTVGEIGGGERWAALLCVGSALSYTFYMLAGSRLFPRTDVLTGTSIVLVGGMGAYWLYALLAPDGVGVRFPGAPSGWVAAFALGAVSTVVGTSAMFAGINRIGPGHASVVTTIEPVVAITAGMVFLGETLTVGRAAGATLVVGALVGLATVEGRRPAQPVS
jgi:drug/metabolite transporter (DMT)-like permease